MNIFAGIPQIMPELRDSGFFVIFVIAFEDKLSSWFRSSLGNYSSQPAAKINLLMYS